MRSGMLCFVAAIVACLAAGCAGPITEGVVEAERLTLKDCSVGKLAGASGGEAVLMKADSGVAKGTVTLSKGEYKVVVYVQGAGSEEDAVYVNVGGQGRLRIFAGDHGKLVPATVMETDLLQFTFTAAKDGSYDVELTAAEPNVYVDRIVFEPKE